MNNITQEKIGQPRFIVLHNDYDRCDEIIDRTLGEAFCMFSLKSAVQLLNSQCRPLMTDGEEYAGIIIGKEGQPDHHLILLPGESDSMNWNSAKEWASEAGGELPTRREQALIYANLKEHFKSDWYWSNTQHAAYSCCAWCQDFGNGCQGGYPKSSKCRARAVRRVAI